MKKIFLSLLTVTGLLLGVTSCTDDVHDPVVSATQGIVLSAPTGGSYTLTAATSTATAFTAKWTSSEFGFNAAARYTLQAIKSTGSFDSSPGELLLGDYNVSSNIDLEKALTNKQLNALLLSAGGSIGSADTFKIRVIGKPVGQSSTAYSQYMVVSNVVTITGNPYDTFDEFQKLYLPGNYGAASGFADWSSTGNSATIFSPANDGNYEGFAYMNVASPAFKFNSDPSWSGHDRGESNSSGAFSGILGGSDIKPADGAGTYFFTVNWTAGTYTMAKRQVAIIGQATPNGWPNPTYLTFDTNPSSPYYKMYTLDLALTADEFLIRLKDDWSVKMGTTSGSTETVTTGGQYKIKLGGGNMKVPTAGNYKIVLDIRNSANYNLRLMPI